ncbi:hypothetical protein, variant [Aphanomyces invadans]|uniref:Cyclic nucleotide-binding domain-containing protein n=1 Tax=Aphanomyces invadans TaxID=157072 RepID=A0A024USS6_9STRA|nr:hypothetical protein, variant [Aphanomyces invadans]ETW09576.1 hypothetical protein, variant [Aphanomyces invadans]|eukprot:XP_008860987.1 hypothetical protein, variant [Aphanomyces invadans]
MQALAHEFNGNRRVVVRQRSLQGRGLQLFHATSVTAAGILDAFEIQVQVGQSGDAVVSKPLQVASYLTVSNVKVLIFKEFGILYEEQILFHRTVLLEDNLELAQCNIHHGSTLYVVQKKRYRSIGASQMTIKSIVLNSAAADGYILVDIPAPLPPIHVIVKRIAFAISYLRQLDVMQQSHTRHKIWQSGAHNSHNDNPRARPHPPSTKQHEMKEALATLRASLVVPFEMRTQADIRVIKKWLGNIKYFSDANVPDTSLLDVSRHITITTYQPGDVVFRQGDPGGGFFVILQGSVSIAGHGAGLFATMKRGECFGDVGLFKNCTGHRSASALVNFDTPVTELACISREVYSRSIGMHKENMLVEYEKLLSECPQFSSFPKETMTLLAYAAQSKFVDSGGFLFHNGSHIDHLYLVVRGEFRVTASAVVSVPRPILDDDNDDDLLDYDNSMMEKRATVMTLRSAPTLFGHEACMKLRHPQSQYDIEATMPSMLLSFSKHALRRFVVNHDAAMQEILQDFELRNQDMDRRLQQVVAHVVAQEPKPDAEMAAIDAFFAHTLSKHGEARSMSVVSQGYPRKLSMLRPAAPPHAEPTPPPPRESTPRAKSKQATGFHTAFAAMCKNHFHETLPHGDLLTYEQQVHYATKPTATLTTEEQLTKMNCLIDGLRRIKPVDVCLVDVIRHAGGDQYCFMNAS